MKHFNIVICFAIVALTTSCTAWRIGRATADLQNVEGSQDCWGKIAVSDINFVPNKGQFNINFNEDVSNYVQAARSNISGDASSSVQSALYIGAVVQGMFAPPISAGAPANSTNLSSQANMPNQAETAVNNFPPPSSSSGLNPTTDERDAVEKGINDKTAETLLKFMANPDSDSNQEAIVFGVVQATCQPGEFTRKGYLAELDVSLKYGRTNFLDEYTANAIGSPAVEPAVDMDTGQAIQIANLNSLSTNSLAHPMTNIVKNKRYYLAGAKPTIEVRQVVRPSVLAVLPLMDSRNMELQNSSQSQIELALALSAAFEAKGMTASANALTDYVKRQQANIQTLNSLPVTTTYSDGPNFGFQLYPAAQAIDNPGESDSSSESILQPVTFPIVVAIRIGKDDMEDGTNFWNYLVTETQTRWIPIEWQFWPWADQLFLSAGGRELGNDVPLYERMRRARKIDQAQAELNLIAPSGAEYPTTIPPQYHYEYQQLQIAIDTLKSSALSQEFAHELPLDLFAPNTNKPAPTITDVFPHSIWRDTNTVFLIDVKGVSDTNDVSSVTIAGISCEPSSIIAYGSTNYTTNSIITTTSITTSSGNTTTTSTTSTNTNLGVVTNYMSEGVALIATLPSVFNSITNTITNNVDFVVLLKHEAPAAKTIGLTLQGGIPPIATATITRDINSKVLSLEIRPGKNVTDKQMLKAIKDILQKSEPLPKTTTIVH